MGTAKEIYEQLKITKHEAASVNGSERMTLKNFWQTDEIANLAKKEKTNDLDDRINHNK